MGFHVDVFGQAPELKPVEAGIALTANGLRALRSLVSRKPSRGRSGEVRASVCRMSGAAPSEQRISCAWSERLGHVRAVELHSSALKFAAARPEVQSDTA
jgi:hypothetical protein